MSSPPTGTVTFLFTDIEDSTKLWERNPKAMQVALARHDEILREAIDIRRGYVFKTVGDAFCAVFPTARDALGAALTSQRALFSEEWSEEIGSLRVRMALHAGAAEERDGDYFGPPLNRVARLLSAGHGGQVLLSIATQELVRDDLPEGVGLRDLGERRLKDLFRTERVFQLMASDLPSDFPPLKTLDVRTNNLPTPRTSFIGREREMVEVKRALTMTRLLTLTGAGGSGKTRLALEVAGDLAGLYADGVWLVELAALSEGELVPQAMADVLGVREQPEQPLAETIVEELREKRMLLILDNCEHLIDACARLVDTLIGSCPKVRVLATSREPLGVAGEALFAVPPLSVPQRGLPCNLTELAHKDSVRLFIERARLRLPGFQITPQNAPAVAQVCRRLEGIPLAIELAAARMRTLVTEQLAERLENSLDLLSVGPRMASSRQKTMRAAIAWSYGLLSEEEKAIVGRLSVFAGGFTLEAAEAVCPGGGIEQGEVLDLLSSLVDKSLVVAEASAEGGVRYRMLEPIRQYAQERLEAKEDADTVRRRYALWCLELAEQAAQGFADPDKQEEWMDRLETEYDNLRAAIQWLLGRGEEDWGLRLVVALRFFWYMTGHLSEGRRWLEKASSRSSPMMVHKRAQALKGAGSIAIFQADYEAARVLIEESLALYRELEDKEGIVSALTNLGFAAVLGQRDLHSIPTLLEEAMGLRPKLKDQRTVAYLLMLAGLVAASQGDLERTVALHEESLVLFRQIRETHGISGCLTNIGLAELARANYTQASTMFRKVLRPISGPRDMTVIQYALCGLGGVALSEGGPARAARLWGAAEAVHEVFGVQLSSLGRSFLNLDSRLAEARARLGEAAFAAAWAEGHAMAMEEAIEYALREEEPASLVPSTPERTLSGKQPIALTPREEEIAALVAQGLTNRQIATELSISEHTAATHVAKILKKLDLHSRSQLAAWVHHGEM